MALMQLLGIECCYNEQASRLSVELMFLFRLFGSKWKFFCNFRDWVYEQADPEKQNKVFELLESVRRWTLNSSAALGGNEDKNHVHDHQRPKIQRSRSTLGELTRGLDPPWVESEIIS